MLRTSDQKLLAIIGPTAVGKSATAVWLAHELLQASLVAGVDCISADSRQIYKDIPILSGADVPPEFSQQSTAELPYPYFAHATTPLQLHGVSMVPSDAEWSVAHFVSFAQRVIAWSWKAGRFPILVGGTGLYLQQLFFPVESLAVSPDKTLRADLAEKSVAELQEQLAQVDPKRLQRMNNSDRNNPRRLVRALELAGTTDTSGGSFQNTFPLQRDIQVTTLGLRDDVAPLSAKITARVVERFEQGAPLEVSRVLANREAGQEVQKPVLATLGFKELAAYNTGEVEKVVALERWAQREVQYVKRQLTWFKKYAQTATWFEASDKQKQESMLESARKLLLADEYKK